MFIEIQNYNLFEIFSLTASLCLIFGHNLWLIGKSESSEETKIEINTGDAFPESETPVKPERIKEFTVLSADGARKISDFRIEGNSLTATVEEKPKAAFVAAIELFPHPITLEAGKFAHYIEDEAAWDFTAPDFTIEKKAGEQRESYAKFAKVLIKNEAENLDIFTAKIGHQLEIVLTELPKDADKKMRVQILFEGKPLKNVRVSSGAESLNGGKYSAHTRTDESGFAEIEIYPKKLQFIRTHFIRRHSNAANFEWESFWASVTFYF